MKYEIDQSGKIEDTARDTVLAIANGKSSLILIKARKKRQIQEIFRQKGQNRLFVLHTFAALIFMLLKDIVSKSDLIIVDTEYPGKEKHILKILKGIFGKNDLEIPHIYFKRIGNHPKVHYVAHNAFIGKSKPHKIIGLKEIITVFEVS